MIVLAAIDAAVTAFAANSLALMAPAAICEASDRVSSYLSSSDRVGSDFRGRNRVSGDLGPRDRICCNLGSSNRTGGNFRGRDSSCGNLCTSDRVCHDLRGSDGAICDGHNTVGPAQKKAVKVKLGRGRVGTVIVDGNFSEVSRRGNGDLPGEFNPRSRNSPIVDEVGIDRGSKRYFRPRIPQNTIVKPPVAAAALPFMAASHCKTSPGTTGIHCTPNTLTEIVAGVFAIRI